MDYKIIFVPKLGEEFSFEKEYETREEAEQAMVAISLYTLMLHECSLMPDYSNTGCVFKKDGLGFWIEIDEDGFEI